MPAPVIYTAPLHEDAFYSHFKPIRHADSQHNIWGGHGLETFGKDFELANGYDPDFVWTVVDDGDGNQWITPGIHYVNRVCFLITEKPHGYLPFEFRVRNNSLTDLGLIRQVRKIERMIADSLPTIS